MRITVDPNVDVSGFGYAEPGEHKLRIAECIFKDAKDPSKSPGLSWRFEFVDPNTPSADRRADGTSKKVGNIFEYTTLKQGENSQFRLRQLCEAVGIEWGDSIDTDEFIGKEFTAQLKVDSYNDEMRNKVAKYMPVA